MSTNFSINNPMFSTLNNSMSKALEGSKSAIRQLSTGERIGEAKEDPAGLAIGTGFRTDMETLKTVLTAANQAKSVVSLVDNGLRQISEILQSLRNLAVQSNSDLLGDAQREQLNVQFTQFIDNLDKLVENTNFNGKQLLDGTISEGNNIVTDTKATEARSTLTHTVQTGDENLELNGIRLALRNGTPAEWESPKFTISFKDLGIGDSDAPDPGMAAFAIGGINFKYGNAEDDGSVSGIDGSDVANAFVINKTASATEQANFVKKKLADANAGYVFHSVSSGGDLTISKKGADSTASTFTFEPLSQTTTSSSTEMVTAAIKNWYKQGDSVVTQAAPAPTGTSVAVNGVEKQADDIGTHYHNLTTAETLEIDFSDDNSATDTNLFVINDVHIKLGAAEATATAATESDWSDAITLDRTNDGTTRAQKIADIINKDPSISLDTGVERKLEGFTAKVDGTKVIINRESKSNAAYKFEVSDSANAEARIKDIKVDGKASDTIKGFTENVRQKDSGQEIELVGTNADEQAELFRSLILDAASDDNLTQRSKDVLTDLRVTGANDQVVLTSKRAGVAGSFAIKDLDANTVTSSSYDVGKDTGSLGRGNVSVVGAPQNTMVGTISNQKASTDWQNINPLYLVDGTTISFGGRDFELRSNVVSGAEDQIQLEEENPLQTLQNIATAFNTSKDPTLANYDFEVRKDVNDSTTNYQMKVTGKVADAQMNGLQTTITHPNPAGPTTNPITLTLGEGKSEGLNLSKITGNEDFVGKVNGFEGRLESPGTLRLSVAVGDTVYESVIDDTNPKSDKVIRMKSTDETVGGFFDFTLTANNGMPMANEQDARNFAAKINEAFEGFTFYQNRDIDTFVPKGTSLENTTAALISNDQSDISIESVEVLSAVRDGGNGQAAMSIKLRDGREFTNDSLGMGLTEGQRIELLNPENSNEKLVFSLGKDVNLNQETSIATFKGDMLKSFQADSEALKFQVGLEFEQTIEVAVQAVDSKALFKGANLSIATQNDAKNAGNILSDAVDLMKELRGRVGALQAGLESATDNISSSIQSLDAARAVFLDADYPTASTEYTKRKVQIQANIAILAETNQLSQNLMKLIG